MATHVGDRRRSRGRPGSRPRRPRHVGRAPRLGPRVLRAWQPGMRLVRRVRVPEDVVALVEADALREAEERLYAHVMARVPPGSSGLRLQLDAERLEVVLSYALDRRRDRSG